MGRRRSPSRCGAADRVSNLYQDGVLEDDQKELHEKHGKLVARGKNKAMGPLKFLQIQRE
ncbi:hypothetical protein PG994_001867 [Apiospora phragmitis]|uniref:Uncharacterized protein n=1 Tax=Apiospora phragmitis TaxID=2905665 RepID=A0ABR1WUV1_9PEZI